MEQQQNAKFAFFYMLSLVSLIFTALSTGMIVFQVVNKKIIDLLQPFRGTFDSGTLKFAISAIVIAAPVYFITNWLISKNLKSGKMDKDSAIRRWLTYFILFIAAVVMIGWLIAILYNFLNGELTLKFIIKALSAFLIAAIVFSYYLYDIRRKDVKIKDMVITIYFYGAIAIVVAALVTSFFFVESPAQTRDRIHDNTILDHFSQIEGALNNYYNNNKSKLPDNLDMLVGQPDYFLNQSIIMDPLTQKKHDYKITGKDGYQLCADFKLSNKNEALNSQYYLDTQWPHDAGYQCITKRATVFDVVKPMPAR